MGSRAGAAHGARVRAVSVVDWPLGVHADGRPVLRAAGAGPYDEVGHDYRAMISELRSIRHPTGCWSSRLVGQGTSLCALQSMLGYSSSGQVSTSASARFSSVRRVTTASVMLDVRWSLCRAPHLTRFHPSRVRRSHDPEWHVCATVTVAGRFVRSVSRSGSPGPPRPP